MVRKEAAHCHPFIHFATVHKGLAKTLRGERFPIAILASRHYFIKLVLAGFKGFGKDVLFFIWHCSMISSVNPETSDLVAIGIQFPYFMLL